MTREILHRKAIELRKAGYSYSAISGQLNIAKSTLSDWLSNVPYKPNKETLNRIGKARTMAIEAQRSKKIKSVEKARILAAKDIGKFSKRDLFMLGIGIYIGEGAKTNDIVRIVNSDPKIISTLVTWFRKILNLQNNNFSIRIHLYPDSNKEEAIKYWSNITKLPKTSFLKTWVDNRTNKKRKNYGKLPYGTLHITVKGCGDPKLSRFLSRRILSWIDIVHRNAGIV